MAANPSGVTGAAYAAFGALLWLALVFLPAPAVMAVILLGAVFMIFDFKPQYFIMLIIASIPFETSRDLAGSFTVYTTEGILFAGAAAWGLKLLKHGFKRLASRVPLIAVAVFFSCIAASFLVSEDLAASIKQFVRWLEIFIVYLIAADTLNEENMFLTANAVVITGFITACPGMAQALMSGFDYRKTVSFFGAHDPYAGYLCLVMPVLISMYLNEEGVSKRLFYGIASIVMFTVLCATFSRGGLAGFTAAYAVLIVFNQNRRRKRLFKAGVALIFIFCAVMFSMPGKFEQPGLPAIKKSERIMKILSNYSVRVRLNYWKTALKTVKEKPLLGAGLGNYQAVHRKHGHTLISEGDEWFGDTIANLRTVAPNAGYLVSMDYKVLDGNIGEDDFIELIKYSPDKKVLFKTCYPNVIIFGQSDGWAQLKGVLRTTTAEKELKDIKLRWAHNEKATVLFKNVTITPREENLAAVEPDYSFFHMHNLYLQILVESGIVGLSGLVYMFLVNLIAAAKNILRLRGSVTAVSMLAAGCLAGACGFMVHSFVDILLTHSIGLLFGILLGVAIAAGREK